jgi:hypothetical protein
MEKTQKKTIRVSGVLAAAISAILLSFMIRTIMLRIVFVSSFFVSVLLLLLVIFDDSSENGVKHRRFMVKANIRWIIYSVALLSSFAAIYFPIPSYNFSETWLFFSSLDLSQIVRISLGYYVLTILPGYAVYGAFARNKLDSNFERLALIFALSFIASVAIGLLLTQTIGLTPVNYLASLWALVFICEALRQVLKKESNKHTTTTTTKNSRDDFIKSTLMISICFILVFSSYLITLSADPMDMSLGGDVSDYVTVSNAFLNNVHFDSPYIWFQVFIGLASILTGLHPIPAFVGLQFLIVILPLSTFSLLMRIFGDDRLAIIGAFVATITGGLSSIGILGLFQAYNEGNTYSTLLTLRTKTENWPWLSNHFFIVSTIEWSLLLLGLGFIYCYIEEKRSSKIGNLALGSSLLASTFFTHNIIGLMVSILTIFVFSLFNYRHLRRAIISLLSILFFLLTFDVLSYNFFVNTAVDYYLHYQVFFAGSSLFPYQWGIITLLLLAFLALLIPRLITAIRKKVEFLQNHALTLDKSIACVSAIVALSLSIFSIAIVATSFNEINFSGETIFPWYIYVIRFSPFLQLALLYVPTMFKKDNEKNRGAWLMVAWTISGLLSVFLNLLFPLFVTPLLVNRVLMSTYFPLGILTALTLTSTNKIKLPKVRIRIGGIHVRIRSMLVYLLAVLIGFSFLSYAYSIESFYQGNMQGSMPSEEKSLYEYLESLPAEKTFLTYSYASYRHISSLTAHKTYACYQYGTYTSWPCEILFKTSSPEVAFYFLQNLGITHIVLTTQDFTTWREGSNNALSFMLNFFPIAFNNSYGNVYSVPNYLLNDSANYFLIKPVSRLNFDLISESLIYDAIKLDNLRVVGGPNTFKLEEGVIIQEIKNVKPPIAQYLQLYKGISIPLELSPIVTFKIKGTKNALYNIGFFDAKKGWTWLSQERGLPSRFFNVTNDWTEMRIDLRNILDVQTKVVNIDFVATSIDGSNATVEWKDFDIYRTIAGNEMFSNDYNLVYDSLATNDVPFAVVEDHKIFTLAPNDVYVFSNSWTGSISSSDLLNAVETGTHAVFFYDSAVSDENQNNLLRELGAEAKGIVSSNNAYVGDVVFNSPSSFFVTNLTVQDSPYQLEIMGYYTTPGNGTVPLIMKFETGTGSIAIVNMPKTFNFDRIVAEMSTKIIRELVADSPKPIPSDTLKKQPFPESLFKLGNPNLVNIYHQESLSDYIYAFSDINLDGNISISSNYALWKERNLPVKRLLLQNSTHQTLFENITLIDVYFNGPCNATLTTQNAVIDCVGNGLAIIETSFTANLQIYLDEPVINLTIEENGVGKTLVISHSYIEFEFANNVTTNIKFEKPLIMLDAGSLNTFWKGLFWYNGKMFTTVARAENWIIEGVLSFEVSYCDYVTVVKFLFKDEINVVIDSN